DHQLLASGPALGRRLIAKLAQLLVHGGLFTAQPRRQEGTDGRQRTGAGQHHPQAPQGQDGGLRFAQVRQVGLDDLGPFEHTGVARHQYPPWGYGVDATAHTMPQSRVSCHLCDAVAPSFFKNLLQKARWGEVLETAFSKAFMAFLMGDGVTPVYPATLWR